MALAIYHVDSYLAFLRGLPGNMNPNAHLRVTADQNDYALGTEAIHEVSSDAARNVTGFVAPAAAAVAVLVNTGDFSITLKHQDAGSVAANRIIGLGAADFVLAAGAFVPLVYDSTAARWVVSQSVPRPGFRVAVVTADGAVLLLDGHYWQIKHLSLESDGTTANTGSLYYRYGLALPVAGLDSDSAAKRESIPILSGGEETVQIKRGQVAMRLLPASGTNLALRVRQEAQGHGLNR